MRNFEVKVRASDGTESVVAVQGTGTHDAAKRALWRFTPGAEVVWVRKATKVAA